MGYRPVFVALSALYWDGGARILDKPLFRQAAAINADLLVMGGFGHSRLRDFVLGGATQQTLTWAPLPILMSH